MIEEKLACSKHTSEGLYLEAKRCLSAEIPCIICLGYGLVGTRPAPSVYVVSFPSTESNALYSRMQTLSSMPEFAAPFLTCAIQSRCPSESGITYPPPKGLGMRLQDNDCSYRERKEPPSLLYVVPATTAELSSCQAKHPPEGFAHELASMRYMCRKWMVEWPEAGQGGWCPSQSRQIHTRWMVPQAAFSAMRRQWLLEPSTLRAARHQTRE